MDYPIHSDEICMELTVLYFKGESNFYKMILVPEACFYPSKQRRPQRDTTLCEISSLSSLFVKVSRIKGLSSLD